MTFKISITCRKCHCTAEVNEKFAPIGGYACPNCGEAMPLETLSVLQTAIGALSALPDSDYYGWEHEWPEFIFSSSGRQSQDSQNTPDDDPQPCD